MKPGFTTEDTESTEIDKKEKAGPIARNPDPFFLSVLSESLCALCVLCGESLP
jgi:hypothetical protein